MLQQGRSWFSSLSNIVVIARLRGERCTRLVAETQLWRFQASVDLAGTHLVGQQRCYINIDLSSGTTSPRSRFLSKRAASVRSLSLPGPWTCFSHTGGGQILHILRTTRPDSRHTLNRTILDNKSDRRWALSRGRTSGQPLPDKFVLQPALFPRLIS